MLSHHGKNPHYYTVVVKGEQVDILPTNSVPEADRFPKVRIKSLQPSLEFSLCSLLIISEFV